MNNSYKFLDLCAGIGGGKLGLESNGFTPLAFSEIDSSAINAYKYFYGDSEKNLGDLMNIDIDSLSDIDALIAGFPCQTFSIVGKRAGLNDERGQIIFGIKKILENKNPKFFILENVKGLLSIDKGQTLNNIINMLSQIGYDVKYKLLDSFDYGVPQFRERVYIVGTRKDLKIDYKFPENKDYKYDMSKFLTDNRPEFILNNNIKKLETFHRYLNNKMNKGKYSLKDLELLNEYTIIDTRQSDLRIFKGKSPTLRKGRHGLLYVKNKQLRYLSGVEAIKLQGFPSHIADKAHSLSNTAALSLAGNAMTVSVISKIANNLLK